MKEIRRIIQLYDQLKAEGTSAALAVVVDVAESSYRRIGARLLVATDGRYVGGISGGCLEGDALRRARTAILGGLPATHTYDTLDGEDAVIGIGLGCEGRIEVLFIPLDYHDENNEIEKLRRLADTREAVVLTRLLNCPDGETFEHRTYATDELQNIGLRVYKSPADLEQSARTILQSGRSKRITISSERGFPFAVLFEILQPEIHLVLTGTNYDIPPTLAAARQLGWTTTLIGAQRKFTAEMKSLADRLVDYGSVGSVTPDAATALVLMSHDFDWDRKMVEHFLPLQPAYLGMLGPKKRAVKMDTLLRESSNLQLLGYPKLYSPVGLDIGAETPEEIAASLTAEIIAVFRGRDGKNLRIRQETIHNR